MMGKDCLTISLITGTLIGGLGLPLIELTTSTVSATAFWAPWVCILICLLSTIMASASSSFKHTQLTGSITLGILLCGLAEPQAANLGYLTSLWFLGTLAILLVPAKPSATQNESSAFNNLHQSTTDLSTPTPLMESTQTSQQPPLTEPLLLSIQQSDTAFSLEEEECEEDESGDLISQSWTRCETETGERIEGLLRITLQPGERQSYFHIPIFPAFSLPPVCWAECLQEEVSCEADSVFPYGARLCIRRRGETTFPLDAEISVVLMTEKRHQRAA